MYLPLNEEMHIRSDKKLRDAVHDLIVDLKPYEYYDLGTISNILRHKFKVFITPNLLERMLNLWEDGKSTNVFRKKDANWLKWDKKEKWLTNNLVSDKSSVLGKSRRKIRRKESSGLERSIKEDGWRRTKQGDWVFVGNTEFQTRGADEIDVTKFEKTKYAEGENPITPELYKKTFIQKFNADVESEEMISEIDEAIKKGEITSSPENGAAYYDETWRLMMHLSKEKELERFRDYLKYAPTKVKEIMLKKKKEDQKRKEEEQKYEKDKIKDPEQTLTKLKEMVNLDEQHYILVLKYKDKKYYVKKLIKGYVDISDTPYADGYFKIVLKKDKNSKAEENEIIFFDSINIFYKAKRGGLEVGDDLLFIFIDKKDENKLKFYFKEFKKFRGWDEFLDTKSSEQIKNDF
jgi:hypothetical protein